MSITAQLQKVSFTIFSSVAPQIAARMFFKFWFKTQRQALKLEEELVMQRASTKEVLWQGQQRVRVYEWGEGPVALLVHGWNGRAAQFCKLVELLQSKGYKVIAFDAPGHGLSDGSESDLPDMVRALKAVFEHCGPVQLLVSHSLGGIAAGKSISDGYAVKDVVLVAPPSSLKGVIEFTREKLSFSISARKVLETMFERKYGPRVWSTFSFDEFGSLVHGVNKVTVIHDVKDREVPWNEGERVCKSMRNSVFLTTSGLGHKRILRSDVFLKMVESCLLRNEGEPSLPGNFL